MQIVGAYAPAITVSLPDATGSAWEEVDAGHQRTRKTDLAGRRVREGSGGGGGMGFRAGGRKPSNDVSKRARMGS